MHYHIVLMSFTPKADAAFFEKVKGYSKRIRSECADVVTYVMVKNLASRSDGLTHAVVSTFCSSLAHDDYQISPVHVEMKSFMAPYIDRIVVLDTEILT